MKYAHLNSYVFSAVHNMVIDMGYTPHIMIVIGADSEERPLRVPEEFAENGFLTINVGVNAVKNWNLDYQDGYLSFEAGFNGLGANVIIPCECIYSVYAKENKNVGSIMQPQSVFVTEKGMIINTSPAEFLELPEVIDENGIQENESTEKIIPKNKTPKLTIVK